MPILLIDQMLRQPAPMQAFEVTHKIVAAPIAEKKSKGRHDGCAANLGRIDEVELEPQRRSASAYLGKVGTLAAISDERRSLPPQFLKGLAGPHIRTSGELGRTYWEWQLIQPSDIYTCLPRSI